MQHIKVIVSHANCPDGIASAMICKHVFPEARVCMLLYGPERDELPVEDGMLFVDMTPPERRMREFVEAGAVVLDHHKTAKPIVEAFGQNGVFGDEDKEPGVSGAVLAFRHVYKPWVVGGHAVIDACEEFSRLVGVRDTWQRSSASWEEACAVSEALKFYPVEDLLDGDLPYLTEEERDVGRLLRKRSQNNIAKAASKLLFSSTRSGCTFAFGMLQYESVSDTAEYLRERGLADVLVSWWSEYNGQMLHHVSLRSNGVIDVGKFARRFGGGGHTRSAGFEVVGGGPSLEFLAVVSVLESF